MRPRIVLPGLLLALTCLGPAVRAKTKTDIRIAPGPAVVSPAEAAIAPDPGRGAEHAVILIEETECDENLGLMRETSFHLRAKILSNEGRDLANVEIPYVARDGTLKQWWGRTLLPDGRVLELREADLEQQTETRVGSVELRTLKAALPGVVPGSIIDYGWVLRESGVDPLRKIALQRRWPIRMFRYRWRPTEFVVAAFRIHRAEGLQVKVTQDRESVLVVGHDLPPVVDEPMMPPDHQVRASATFYYVDPKSDADDFWGTEAKRIERGLRFFLVRERPILDTIASWNLPASADLTTRLHAAYQWIGNNVRDTELYTAEEIEAAGDDGQDERNTAKWVLEQRAGSGYQVSALFVGFARALGAEASLVLAANRTEHFWDPGLKSVDSFDYVLVAVRAPGEPDDRAVLVDPGTGLTYGEVPWWLTGVPAMLATAKGARPIQVPPSDLRRNVSQSRVSVRIGEEGLNFTWSKTGKGQVGFTSRRHLRRLAPDDRAELVEELCGGGDTYDVLRAESPGLDQLFSDFQLECEIETADANFDSETTRYRLGFTGPWIEPVPDLEGRADRVHPVVFSYPRVDMATVEVASPSGFAPSGETPAPVSIDSPYGRYRFAVTPSEGGYKVERALALSPLIVPAAEYDALRRFLDDVRRADAAQLAFERVGSDGGDTE